MRDRRKITVTGIVQGVGFRPFVYGLAGRLGLGGTVRNDTAGVVIDVEGKPESLKAFLQALVAEAPPLAVIERVATESKPVRHYTTFTIEKSQAQEEKAALISPDIATCPDCLKELADPQDRRSRYPFLNCTNCGPRFTIVLDIPYDRERTTMAEFTMCPACRAEYEDPRDRRFHAQPTACPACGPRLQLTDSRGNEMPVADPLGFLGPRIREGQIVAVKGIGGYHLCCDALQDEAVLQLRRRKHREAKPLAIMVPDLETVRRLCEVSAVEAKLLTSPKRPIVLLRKRPDCPIAEEVAPRNRYLGVMLPYTPLHHLLLRAVGCPVVLTSGNLSEEPIAYEDREACARLGSIADYFLTHDRPIHTRCDDSVVRVVLGREILLRRSRGYAPQPLLVDPPFRRPVIACGGHLKNTFCLGKGERAFFSHHIGDLENYETLRSFATGVEHFQRLFDIQPEVVAHDLHPDYLSTQYAQQLSDLEQVAVQHHHAHVASCLAEHRITGPVIGVAFDGTGYGTDGAIWGGEFLLADLRGFERVAHLAYVPLAGGDRAIREPWRMAAVYLHRTFGEEMDRLPIPYMARLDRRRWDVLRQAIRSGLNSPPTSSMGRLFDAVASLVGLRDSVAFEGQAAVELEMAADPDCQATYPVPLLAENGTLVADPAKIVAGVVEDLLAGRPVPMIAGRFHNAVRDLIVMVCRRLRDRGGPNHVVLTGGVFQNALLLEKTVPALVADGFGVYTHGAVPPNDGGLALGQAVVANARQAE